MAIEYDAMGNATGITTPESGILTPAQMRTDKLRQDQTRQMQGFLKVGSGFAGKLTGTNDAETKSAIEKFQKENGLDPAKASPEETLSKMRANLLQNPKAVENMKTLIDTKDPDNVKAAQYGLAAFGTPLEPNGQVNVGTTNALDRLAAVQAANAKGAVPAAPKFDPQIQKAQGYMRMLGLTDVEVDGQKKRLVVDGMNGTNTQTALAKYNTDHGLAKDAGLEVSLRHMEENLKKNGPELQQRLNGIMEQGTGALRSDVRGMQLTMNLLKNESLKVDGINGINTTTAYNKYSGKNYPVPTAPVAATPASADPLGDFIKERGLDKPELAATTTVPVAQPPLVVDGEDPAVSRMKRENAATPASRPVAPQRPEILRQNPVYSLREPYNNASGVEQLNRTLGERAELRAQGYRPEVAKEMVSQTRRMELMNQGMDERTAMQRVNQESRMADLQERSAMRTNRNVYNEDRVFRQTEGQRRQADAENTRDGRTAGTILADMGGLRGNERRMAVAVGGLGAKILGGVLGDDKPSTAQERGYGRTAREIGSAAGGNTIGRGAEVLVRQGGNLIGNVLGGSDQQDVRRSGSSRVIEYPQQARSSYEAAASGDRWNSNQISGGYNNASSYGVTEAQREQIIAEYQMQQDQAAQTPDNSYNNRNPNNIFTPGG